MASLVLALALAVIGFAGSAQAEFDPLKMLDWRAHAFSGEVRYEATTLAGQPALRAQCDNAASGLFLDERVDLTRTPILEWRWRVERVFPLDGRPSEREKAGDDFSARVYVVREALLPWNTRAINYVWASGEPVGADWPNPYAQQARMVVLQSGPIEVDDDGSIWRVERRNVREDFWRFHDRELDRVDAVAIMTDCDDRTARAEAWYGGMRWVAE